MSAEQRPESIDYVLLDDDAIAAGVALVGAKGATLAAMRHAGLPVPRLAAVTVAAFSSHLTANAIDLPQPGSVLTPDDADRLRGQIQRAPIPAEAASALVSLHDSFVGKSVETASVAVRSSAGEEDGAESSYAGQFSSFLAVRGHDRFLEAVRACWASYVSGRAVGYRAARAVDQPLAASMGVIVQAQLYPEKAGVLFTRHPMSDDPSLAYLEANFGTGESVVGALTLPDGITADRMTGATVDVSVGDKPVMTVVRPGRGGSETVETPRQLARRAVLGDDDVRRLMALGRRIETLLGDPQDIEWAIADAQIWILQARPATGVRGAYR